MAKRIISRFMDTNGDGTGTKNAIGTYASAAEDFYIEATGNPLAITRMIASVHDNGGMTAGEYGNTNSALTNGVSVIAELGGVDYDLTDGIPVKTNAGWGELCYDANVLGWGSGTDLLVVRWTFSKSGTPIFLEKGDKVIARLNDDFDDLIAHHFLVQGYEIY